MDEKQGVPCNSCGKPLETRSEWRYHLIEFHQVLPREQTIAGQMMEPVYPIDSESQQFRSDR